jgi:hypothetical protein
MDPNIVNHRFGPPSPLLDLQWPRGNRTKTKFVVEITEGQHDFSLTTKTVEAGKTTLATKWLPSIFLRYRKFL